MPEDSASNVRGSKVHSYTQDLTFEEKIFLRDLLQAGELFPEASTKRSRQMVSRLQDLKLIKWQPVGVYGEAAIRLTMLGQEVTALCLEDLETDPRTIITEIAFGLQDLSTRLLKSTTSLERALSRVGEIRRFLTLLQEQVDLLEVKRDRSKAGSPEHPSGKE